MVLFLQSVMTADSYRKENAPHFRLTLPVSRQKVVGSSHATRLKIRLQRGSAPAAVRCFRVNAARIVFLMTVPQFLAPWEVHSYNLELQTSLNGYKFFKIPPFRSPSRHSFLVGPVNGSFNLSLLGEYHPLEAQSQSYKVPSFTFCPLLCC